MPRRLYLSGYTTLATFRKGGYSLHRAWINTELLSNYAHAWPSRNRQSLPDALFHLRSYPRAA